MSTQIQIRRDTTANWESANPVLAEGELGYDLTAGQFKVGDGTSAWMALEYSGGGDDLWIAEVDGDKTNVSLKDIPELARTAFRFSYGSNGDVFQYVNNLWAQKTLQADKIYCAGDNGELTATSIESKTSATGVTVALEQTVLGGIVIGKTDLDAPFTEQEEADAMALQTAIQIIKPDPIFNKPKISLDIDKDGNITAKGVVQAADFLDSDGNSIIGAGGDLPDNLVTYNAVLENPETGWYIHSTDLGASSDQAQGFTEITVGTTPQKSAVSLTSGDGPRGEFAALTLSNNESESWPFELKVFGGFSSGEANIWGSAGEWIIDAAKISLGDPNSSIWREVKVNGAIQANDFLDADGNSIVGGGGEVDGLINDKASESIFVGALHPDSPNRGNYLVSLGHKNKVDRTGSIAVGWGAEAKGDNGCMAVGIESKANHLGATAVGPYATVTNYSGIALGIEAATTQDFEFVISPHIQTVNFSGATVQAKDYLDANGNPATVSPSTMVDAFTTLQTAIADETTIEGIKTALTNSLGGLIEKFEGMKNDNL